MKIINPTHFFNIIRNKFDKNDLLILITTFILGFINNFYFIIGNGVAPDSLSTSYFNIANKWEIQLGRFFIRYVNYARYGFVNKLIIVLISLLCIAIAVMLLKRLFKIKNKMVLFLLACVMCVAPQFTETYMFIYCADAYLIAFMFSVLSVYLLRKTNVNKIYYFAVTICVIIVCALYQAYLGVILGLLIVSLIYDILLEEINLKEFIVKFIKYMLAIFIGVIAYYIGLKLLLHILDLELASYKGANSLGINTILDLPKTILRCYIDFYNFFITDKIIYNGWFHRKWLYIIMSIFTITGMLRILMSSNKVKVFKILTIVLLLLVYPIYVNIMDIIAAGTTTNLVTGPGLLVTILFPILVLDNTSEDNVSSIISWITTLSCFLLICSFVLENTFTYVVREQSFDNYKTISMDLYTKATSLDEYKKDMPWMFSDVIRFKSKDYEKANGFISNDNVTWNNYNGTIQNKKFFEKYVGLRIDVVDKSIYNKIKTTEEFKTMPVYPEKGSIRIIDGVVVVKVSNDIY